MASTAAQSMGEALSQPASQVLALPESEADRLLRVRWALVMREESLLQGLLHDTEPSVRWLALASADEMDGLIHRSHAAAMQTAIRWGQCLKRTATVPMDAETLEACILDVTGEGQDPERISRACQRLQNPDALMASLLTLWDVACRTESEAEDDWDVVVAFEGREAPFRVPVRGGGKGNLFRASYVINDAEALVEAICSAIKWGLR